MGLSENKRRQSLLSTLCFAVAACAILTTSAAQAQSTYQEKEVKAAFIFNFARFIEWPATAFLNDRSPIIVAVVGDDEFAAALAKLTHGKTANGRELVVKPLGEGHDLYSCHVVFISSAEKKRLAQIIEGLRGSNALTVSQSEQFLQRGGMINFFKEDSKLRFQVNLDGAERGGLKISSKLLGVAKVYKEEGRAERN